MNVGNGSEDQVGLTKWKAEDNVGYLVIWHGCLLMVLPGLMHYRAFRVKPYGLINEAILDQN